MQAIKIALSGYNALNDNDPSHFSVYFDGTVEHTLVKEKTRGVTSISAFSQALIPHGLSYLPFYSGFVEVSSGEFQYIYNYLASSYNSYVSYVDTTNVRLYNGDGSTKSFSYIIFYDQL